MRRQNCELLHLKAVTEPDKGGHKFRGAPGGYTTTDLRYQSSSSLTPFAVPAAKYLYLFRIDALLAALISNDLSFFAREVSPLLLHPSTDRQILGDVYLQAFIDKEARFSASSALSVFSAVTAFAPRYTLHRPPSA
ncbi:hypothetical protein VTO58DRAFT_104765 [Aureobasidium pullulans]